MLPSFVKEPLVSFSYNYRPPSGISWDKVTRKECEWWSRFNLHLHERRRGGMGRGTHFPFKENGRNYKYHISCGIFKISRNISHNHKQFSQTLPMSSNLNGTSSSHNSGWRVLMVLAQCACNFFILQQVGEGELNPGSPH